MLLGFFVVAVAGAYVGSYLREKGKNLATKEDLEAIVDQVRQTTKATEDIKAQIGAEMWVEQERWKLRRDLYMRLLENLGQVRTSTATFREMMGPMGTLPTGPGRDFQERWKQEEFSRCWKALDELQSVIRVAGVILGPEAIRQLDQLWQDMAKARSSDQVMQTVARYVEAVDRALDGLFKAAKTDLRL